MDNLTKEEIIARITRTKVNSELGAVIKNIELFSTEVSKQSKFAAVLVPLYLKDNSWHVLYTLRTNILLEHSGQVAFPGGQSDPKDASPIDTAIREAYEEIGIKYKDVSIIGILERTLTITNYFITPVVAFIPWPYKFAIAESEVSKVFSIPLEWLANPANYSIITRDIPPHYYDLKTIFYKQYDNEVLWGISAKITLQLVDLLY